MHGPQAQQNPTQYARGAKITASVNFWGKLSTDWHNGTSGAENGLRIVSLRVCIESMIGRVEDTSSCRRRIPTAWTQIDGCKRRMSVSKGKDLVVDLAISPTTSFAIRDNKIGALYLGSIASTKPARSSLSSGRNSSHRVILEITLH